MHAEIAVAWVFVVISVIGWPTSIVWWARTEPPATLSLSWLAILIEAVVYLKASRVHRDQETRTQDGQAIRRAQGRPVHVSSQTDPDSGPPDFDDGWLQVQSIRGGEPGRAADVIGES